MLFSDGFCRDFAAAITGSCSGSWLANERKWRQRLTSNLVASHGWLPRGKISCQVFVCDFEIFLAAAVMTGSTCVVQCHNNKSNHRAGILLHWSPASGPAMEKRTNRQCSYLHTVRISTREAFWLLHGRVFPEGCSCRKISEVDYSIAHSNYMEKRTEKNIICVNKTKGNLPNLITQLKW